MRAHPILNQHANSITVLRTPTRLIMQIAPHRQAVVADISDVQKVLVLAVSEELCDRKTDSGIWCFRDGP